MKQAGGGQPLKPEGARHTADGTKKGADAPVKGAAGHKTDIDEGSEDVEAHESISNPRSNKDSDYPFPSARLCQIKRYEHHHKDCQPF